MGVRRRPKSVQNRSCSHLDVAALQQFGEAGEQRSGDLVVDRSGKQASRSVHVLPGLLSLFEYLRWIEDGNDRTAGRGGGQGDREGVREGNGVVDNVERSARDLRYLCLEISGGKLAVYDMRRSEALEESSVIRRGRRHDGGESRESSELDGYA